MNYYDTRVTQMRKVWRSQVNKYCEIVPSLMFSLRHRFLRHFNLCCSILDGRVWIHIDKCLPLFPSLLVSKRIFTKSKENPEFMAFLAMCCWIWTFSESWSKNSYHLLECLFVNWRKLASEIFSRWNISAQVSKIEFSLPPP